MEVGEGNTAPGLLQASPSAHYPQPLPPVIKTKWSGRTSSFPGRFSPHLPTAGIELASALCLVGGPYMSPPDCR